MELTWYDSTDWNSKSMSFDPYLLAQHQIYHEGKKTERFMINRIPDIVGAKLSFDYIKNLQWYNINAHFNFLLQFFTASSPSAEENSEVLIFLTCCISNCSADLLISKLKGSKQR